MTHHHKEHRGVLLYAFVFFVCLAVAAFSLLIQLQASSQTTAEFFEPIQVDLEQLF